ncbi:hypothetical protein [Streptomyces sp. NPDC057284]
MESRSPSAEERNDSAPTTIKKWLVILPSATGLITAAAALITAIRG